MEVQAVWVVARDVAEEAVAVLGRAEASADGTAHDTKTVHGADGRPRVLLAAVSYVRACAAVAGVILSHALVIVDHKLRDVSVLAEVLRLAQQCCCLGSKRRENNMETEKCGNNGYGRGWGWAWGDGAVVIKGEVAPYQNVKIVYR